MSAVFPWSKGGISAPSYNNPGHYDNPILTTHQRVADLKKLLDPMERTLEKVHAADQDRFIKECRDVLAIAFPEFYPGAHIRIK